MRPIYDRVLTATVTAAVWLAAVCVPSAWASKPPASPIQVTLSAKAWTTVPLPAMALGITEHNGVLWACGADEMLARSDDQGRTWTVVHFYKGGELLFAVAFAGKDGWAMGSQGRELHSGDDGAHWKSMRRAPGNVIRLVAADSRHLMANSPQGFLESSDGGNSWLAKGLAMPNQVRPRRYPVKSIAMPDAAHAGALLEMPPTPPRWRSGPQFFVSTANSGKTWQMIEFPAGVHLDSVSSDAKGYRATGTRQSGKSSSSVVFHSADGLHWSVTPNQPSVFWCHRRECMLSDHSGWVEWDHGAAAYWKTASLWLTGNHWAAIPGVFCSVGDGLRCALAQRLAGAPPEPAPPPANSAGSSRVKASGKVTEAKCLRCAPPQYPEPERDARISGEVLLHAVIGKSGRIRDLTLLAAPSPGLAKEAMETVSRWRYQPTLLNGHPVEVDTVITVNFTLAS